ncbi:MAG: hypothetical protein U0350_23690 [Caldilineaceae bacterium]
MTGADPTPLRDQLLIDYLTQLGYAVTVRTDQAVLTDDAIGKNLVIISESILSRYVNTKFRDVAVPVLTWEGWLLDDMQMTGPTLDVDYGKLLMEKHIRIVNPNHPLAGGLSGVVQTTFVKDQVESTFHWGVPSANAIVIAMTLVPSPHAHIFAYEQGAWMVGMAAPARRIFIHNATGYNLTDAGWTIFAAAVDWALNCSAPNTPTATPTMTPTMTPTTPAIPSPTATSTPTVVNPPPATPTFTPTATFTPSATATAPATATVTPSAPATSTATPTFTPTATATPGKAELVVTKKDFLFNDADGNNVVSPNDKLLYVITIVNRGQRAAQQVHVEDTVDPNTLLVAGSVRTDQGVVTKGNGTNDGRVIVDMDSFAAGASATLSLQVNIKASITAPQIQNQAIATFENGAGGATGQTVVVSDDPDSNSPLDATKTPLYQSAPAFSTKVFLPVIQRK